MEEIFIQALAERSKKEVGLIDQLPNEIKVLVDERLSAEVQDVEIITEE